MISKKTIYYSLLFLAFTSIIAVGYWESLYHLNSGNELRHEYRVGTVMTMTYTIPFWLGSAAFGIYRKDHLTKNEIIYSFIPAVFIALFSASWGM